jgi:hypothetical protein
MGEVTLGGMDNGVAFAAAVPGLAPGAFMGQGSGCPCYLDGLASESKAGPHSCVGTACDA